MEKENLGKPKKSFIKILVSEFGMERSGRVMVICINVLKFGVLYKVDLPSFQVSFEYSLRLKVFGGYRVYIYTDRQ